MTNDQPHLPPPPPPPPRAPGLGFTFFQSCLAAGCATIVAPVVLLLGLLIVVIAVAGYVGLDESDLGAVSSGDLSVREVRKGASGAGVIAIVSVHGAITGDGSPLNGDGALAFVSGQLRQVREDERIKAVLLQVDSPGGGLTASDQLRHEVIRTRESGRTVIAWAGDAMASGGYYVAVGAEGVMASPTCTVGSIGVMMRHFQAAELMRKLGVESDPILSAEHKDIGSMYRAMTPEERALLQDYIDAAHRRFVEVVAEGRGLPRERVAELADGRLYTPEQALENGLVDRIGYVEDALAWIEEKTGEKDMRVVAFRRLFSLGELFREVSHGVAGAVADRAAGSGAAPRVLAR